MSAWDTTERSWSPVLRDEPQPYPPATFLIAMAALLVLAIAALCVQDTRCRQWAGNDPARVAACDDLNR